VSNTLLTILSIAITVACMVGSYFLAVSKGRGPILWTILAFFFSFISLIILALIPAKTPKVRQSGVEAAAH
jgi:predicted PurR-regulated permease PerM